MYDLIVRALRNVNIVPRRTSSPLTTVYYHGSVTFQNQLRHRWRVDLLWPSRLYDNAQDIRNKTAEVMRVLDDIKGAVVASSLPIPKVTIQKTDYRGIAILLFESGPAF